MVLRKAIGLAMGLSILGTAAGVIMTNRSIRSHLGKAATPQLVRMDPTLQLEFEFDQSVTDSVLEALKDYAASNGTKYGLPRANSLGSLGLPV